MLKKITKDETIKIAPDFPDRKTLKPQTVWFVRVGNDIYVRAYRGTQSKWYQAAIKQGTGYVYFDGQKYPATFKKEPAQSFANKTVNQNYLAKYHGSSILWMVETAVNSTLKILKR